VPPKGLEAAVLTALVVTLIASITVAAAGLAPSPFYVVEGRSMEPSLHLGDLVVALPVNPREVRVGPQGDVIIYRDGLSKLIIHRALSRIEVGGRLFFLTKGDNNDRPDQDPSDYSTWLPGDRIVARMVFAIPIAGYPFLDAYKPFTQAALLAALAYTLYLSLAPRARGARERSRGRVQLLLSSSLILNRT
jgi:signal peptidase